MPALWRLYRARHGAGLDGTGGTFADGRWHTRGERIVYFGASAAIVVLERLAHTDPDLLPNDLRLALFELPNSVAVARVDEHDPLPADWIRNESVTRRIGARWRRQGNAAILWVPSAILPEESNLLLNPQHSDARRLELIRERAFTFDARLI